MRIKRRLLRKRRPLWISGKNHPQQFNHVPLTTDWRETTLRRIMAQEPKLRVIKF